MANPQNVERKWYVIDAEGMVLGRLASQVAAMLRGKHKPTFTPNVDCGDFVIIVNTDQAVLTGKKLDQKKYYHFTGWIGNLKETKYRHLMEQRSDFAMELAVKGMLPKNKLARQILDNLYIYEGPEHKHQAQSPKTIDINQYK